jgi:hypothetical protein
VLNATGKGKHSPCSNTNKYGSKKLVETPLNLMNDPSNTAYRVAEHKKRVAAAKKAFKILHARAIKAAKKKAEYKLLK